MVKTNISIHYKYFIFSLVIFSIGYLFNIVFPNLFIGTDYKYYLALIEGQPQRNSIEPLFKLLCNTLGIFLKPEMGYIALGMLSLTIKSYFFSLLFKRKKYAYPTLFFIILIYFFGFFGRFEIGSIRNAYGIDILQFIILFNNFYSKFFIVLLTFAFHSPTGIIGGLWLFSIYIFNQRNIDLDSLITNLKLIFLNLKIKIPKKIKIKFLVYSIFFLSLIILISIQLRLAEVIRQIFAVADLKDFEYRNLNIFQYHRSYIILSTIISSIILYTQNKKKRISNFYNQYLIQLVNKILYLLIAVIVVISLLSFLPASTVMQRLGLIASYFCLISNMICLNILNPSQIFFKRISYKILQMIFLTFLSLGLISSEISKVIFQDYLEGREEELKKEFKN